jgi:alpha-tubulin suppressor-like RCC1 family protein
MVGGGWIYTWGSGFHGQLALGLTTVSLVPSVVDYFVRVHMLVSKIATSSHHCLAVTKEGELYSWGSNKNGCLGRLEVGNAFI